MNNITAFCAEDVSTYLKHELADCFNYIYDQSTKIQSKIKDTSTTIIGNRFFHSLLSGSDGTCLNLSFDLSTFKDIYILYGGLIIDEEDYKTDPNLYFYCIDQSDKTISEIKTISLLDNTNQWMHEGNLEYIPTFFSAPVCVNVDDDCTEAIFISFGGMGSKPIMDADEYIYDYTEAYDVLKRQTLNGSTQTSFDVTVFYTNCVRTGFEIQGFGNSVDLASLPSSGYTTIMQSYNTRTRISNDVTRDFNYSQESYNTPVTYFNGKIISAHESPSLAYKLEQNGPLDSFQYFSDLRKGAFMFSYKDSVYMFGGTNDYGDLFYENLEKYCYTDDTVIENQSTQDSSNNRTNFGKTFDEKRARAYYFGGTFAYQDEDTQELTDIYLDTAGYYDVSSNEFVNITSIPVTLGKHTATIVDDKIYIIGGKINETEYNTNIYEYDIEKDSYKIVKSNIRTRITHGAEAYDGTIYIFGGQRNTELESEQVYSEIDIFVVKRSSSDKWEYIDYTYSYDNTTYQIDKSYPELGAKIVKSGDYFYAYGGDYQGAGNAYLSIPDTTQVYKSTNDSTNLLRFDFTSLEQTKLADNTVNPRASQLDSDMIEYDGTIYYVGGQTYDDTAYTYTGTNKFARYIIDEDRQEAGPDLPNVVMNCKMLVYDNTIQLYAAPFYGPDYTQDAFYSFDISSQTWSTLETYGGVCWKNFGWIEVNGKLYKFFGADSSPDPFIQKYDTTTNSWTQLSINIGSDWFSMRGKPFVKNNKIYAYGYSYYGDYNHITASIVIDVEDETFDRISQCWMCGGGDSLNGKMYPNYFNQPMNVFIDGNLLYVFQDYIPVISVHNFNIFEPKISYQTVDETNFFDYSNFEISQDSYFMDSSNIFTKIYSVNPYSNTFGHAMTQIGSSKLLKTCGAKSTTPQIIDNSSVLPIFLTLNILKDLTNFSDYVTDVTLSDGTFGLEEEFTDKTSDWDFGSDNTAGVDGWYALVNIDSTTDVTNVVIEVIGGAVSRIGIHYPEEETTVFDQNKISFPADIDITESSLGSICIYVGVPEGTVIKNIQCNN